MVVLKKRLKKKSYDLDVPIEAKEKDWQQVLNKILKGKLEVKIPFGRIDIVTPQYAIEVDFLHKW